MLDNKGFDLWADGYDLTVDISDGENKYPFAGYKEILGRIFQIIMEKHGAAVLDIGIGTGTLATRLYKKGCLIFGQDFSAKMIESASRKMPNARLCQGDFSQGLAEELQVQNYDFIVATYSLHHLPDEQKIDFLHSLLSHLNAGGKILIGDVAFKTREDMKACREKAGDEWDDEEIYFVIDEMKQAFPNLRYQPVSYCSGIITLSR